MNKRTALCITLLLSFLVACPGGTNPVTPKPPPPTPTTLPPEASEIYTLEVPAPLSNPPFDEVRTLMVPPDFEIEVYARVSAARFMAVTPDGYLLVSQPRLGSISIVKDRPGQVPGVTEFISDLSQPHDMVFHEVDGTLYLYVAESNRISRFPYVAGASTLTAQEVLIDNLPDAGSINRAYGHELKNIALDDNDNLYVSIASACDACKEDAVSDPVRGAIYRYDADGSNRTLFAEGLRNAEGLAFLPGTNELWVTNNGRDDIPYPFNNDFDGDGQNDYGEVIQAYVDNHPPDGLTLVEEGDHFGWPFCNPNPGTTAPFNYDNMPLNKDVDTNPNGTELDCGSADRFVQGIQAHSVPLGLQFLEGTNLPESFQNSLAIAYKGSFNRTEKTGYKIALFPWDENGPGQEQDLVSGWLDEGAQTSWGRPVDIATAPDGNLYISDEPGNAIYKLSYVGD